MADPLPGDIFQRGQVLNNTYEIEAVLGRGGTGEVYRARNQITGRVVAVKALNRIMSANDAYLELMRREEEMRAITSDAVVRYTDCARSDEGHVYLVMDYVDGRPLSDWLERGRADPRDLLTIARRVAEGLVATHARNIVHRDLSPDNVILRRDDPAQAVIIDFGIAKDGNVGSRTIVGQDFAGKYEYAAPEQMHGRAELRSDLYALGVMLLALYRGAPPEIGRSPGEIIARKQQPPDVSDVPEPLRALIAALTEPDPAQRMPSAAALVAQIDRLGTLTPARPTPPGGRRWPLLALLAGTAAAACLAAAWSLGLLGGGSGDEAGGRPPELVLVAPPAEPAPPAPAPAPAPLPVPSAEALAPAPDPLRAAVAPLQTCGPIDISGLGETVLVVGKTADEVSARGVEDALRPLLGSRQLLSDLTPLNPAICRILAVLPLQRQASQIAISLGYTGETRRNLTARYGPGDRPSIGLVAPNALTQGHLWVVLVDLSDWVVQLLPTPQRPETALAAYPPSGRGRREISLPANLIVSSPYGKSMIFAIVTDRPLFAAPRPAIEPAADFAAALAAALAGGVRVLSVAEQVLETDE